jgi:hypothetical protein
LSWLYIPQDGDSIRATHSPTQLVEGAEHAVGPDTPVAAGTHGLETTVLVDPCTGWGVGDEVVGVEVSTPAVDDPT